MAILRFLFISIASSYCTITSAQKTVKISVTQNQELIESDTSTKKFLFIWDEVVVKNRKTMNKINSAIQNGIKHFKKEIPWDAAEYSPEFKVAYSKNNLITYTLTEYTYFEGAPHGNRQFQTLNFNALTGEQINFRNFITSNKIAEMDSIIIYKLKEQLQVSHDEYLDHYRQQLPNLFFENRDNGIRIIFIGDSYGTSIIDIYLDFKELEQFVNKNGLLKHYYP